MGFRKIVFIFKRSKSTQGGEDVFKVSPFVVSFVYFLIEAADGDLDAVAAGFDHTSNRGIGYLRTAAVGAEHDIGFGIFRFDVLYDISELGVEKGLRPVGQADGFGMRKNVPGRCLEILQGHEFYRLLVLTFSFRTVDALKVAAGGDVEGEILR